jgi:hypothetical protein
MMVHNVRDRRSNWIGPWEVEAEPLDIAKLTPDDKGRTVIYQDYGRAEAGTLSSWTDSIVFVRFHQGSTAAGCGPSDLRFAIRDASPDFYHPPTGLAGR